MKQATTRKREEFWFGAIKQRLKETSFILLCSLSIYFFIALVTYHAGDPAWSYSGVTDEIHNAAGKTGAWSSDILFSIFGYMAYAFPGLLGFACYVMYRAPVTASGIWLVRGLGLVVTLLASSGFMAIHGQVVAEHLPMHAGGMLGDLIGDLSVDYLNTLGASLALLAALLTGVTLLTGFSWIKVATLIGKRTQLGFPKYFPVVQAVVKKYWSALCSGLCVLSKKSLTKPEEIAPEALSHACLLDEPLPPIASYQPQPVTLSSQAPVSVSSLPLSAPSAPVKKMPRVKMGAVSLPSLQLLEKNDKTKGSPQGYNAAQLQTLSRCVEARLLEFGVQVKVVGVHPGPVITRFELDLAAGIKVSRISALAKDLARALSVVSVRIVEVIPGKPVVGLEIPNTQRALIRLQELLEDPSYAQADSPLSLALGKDISGKPIVVDLAKMPHLLVAGTTGSGKSVGINAMLLSILYKATPELVRLILIDPKMLELAVYDDIPHLLTPVVTDMKDAANALRWCVAEMERRYQLMAAMGVRNLSGYNQKLKEGNVAEGSPLPFIVVVIDEFADMIMVVGKKVEELIARIAQKARAAGIHLVLATQRPSVDVITGLIKANIPTRVAFQVSSRIDSRTILDQSGAEQLLGHGDMLYLPPGVGIPYRVHGAFVSDDEVHSVVNAWRLAGKPEYIESVVQSAIAASLEEEGQDTDELYDQAVAIVTEARKGSISLVQRRLKIGYNRAARLIERMEAEGIVGQLQSSGSREVLAPPPPPLGKK